jgi:prenyltransferase beta subunit
MTACRFVLCGFLALLLLSPSTILAADEADAQVDQAVVRALDFLVTQQRPSGGWVVDAFGGETTSATSLAVMSFLAAGHVPEEGPYAPAIRRGVQYVLDQQRPDGLVVSRNGHGTMYCHGISTLMLAEVCGMLQEPQEAACRKALERAIKLLISSQEVKKDFRNAGGWRYGPTSGDSDLSVTGWQLLALRAAKNIGCDVPAGNIDEAVSYVRRCGQGNTGGFGYQPGAGATAVLTGTGLTALQVCGAETDEEKSRGLDYLKARPLKPQDAWYFYGVYYCCVGGYKLGEAPWKELRPLFFETLLSQQQVDGSWRADNGNEKQFGAIYPTGMAVLALTVEYGYLPIYQR